MIRLDHQREQRVDLRRPLVEEDVLIDALHVVLEEDDDAGVAVNFGRGVAFDNHVSQGGFGIFEGQIEQLSHSLQLDL